MQLRQLEILVDIIESSRKAKCKVADLAYGDYETYGKFNPSTVSRHFGSWTLARKKAAKADYAKLTAELRKLALDTQREEKKAHILNVYIEQLKATGNAPAAADLAQAGISRDTVARAFGSLGVLEQTVRDEHPDLFRDVQIHSLFSPKAFEDLDEAVQTKKRFVITTAVNGCDVHQGFLDSIHGYCAENDAALLVLVS